jgi:hypothetical protein
VMYGGSVDDAQGEVHILVRRNMCHLDVVETGIKGESFTSNSRQSTVGVLLIDLTQKPALLTK